MTPEELKAQEEAKKAAELKTSQLQKQIDDLTKAAEATRLAAEKGNQLSEAEKAAEAEAKLKAEADIKKLLSEDKDVDIEDLSNKEILDIIANAFDTAIDAKAAIATEEAAKGTALLSKKLDSMRDYILQKDAVEGINAARGKFKDFDKFEEDIKGIFKVYPSMSPEDACLLAKSKKAKEVPAPEETDSERPINLGTRQSAAEEEYMKKQLEQKEHPDKKPIISRRGFKSDLMAAVNKVVGNRKE